MVSSQYYIYEMHLVGSFHFKARRVSLSFSTNSHLNFQ
uniref:Uncharacterized protein n=1 Tax=Arundo donax TaxID=35708 RepID=A0A0A9GAM1_ARUDO